jgi:thiol-disulfide isomerase/thioredoxin
MIHLSNNHAKIFGFAKGFSTSILAEMQGRNGSPIYGSLCLKLIGQKMRIDLSEIRRRTVSVDRYINGLEQPFKEKYLARGQTYELQRETVDRLREFANRYVVIVFSAVWCKDCSQDIPVLALIAESTGLEVRVFGGLKKDPLSHTCKWRIPPSPQEVITFNVDKIPLMMIVDVNGGEIGRIVESPKRWPTLEQELYEIIKSR